MKQAVEGSATVKKAPGHVQLPPELVQKLLVTLSSVRRVQWVRGGMATAAVAIAAILTVMAIDATFTLMSPLMRWTLSLGALSLTLVTAHHFLWLPLTKRLTPASIARLVDQRHPEFQERVSTTVELLGVNNGTPVFGSEQLIAEVAREAVVDAAGLAPKTEFSLRLARRYLWAAGTCGLVLFLLLVVWPTQTIRLLGRAILPFANIGTAGDSVLHVSPGDLVIASGDTLRVHVRIRGRHIVKAQFYTELPDGEKGIEKMLRVQGADERVAEFVMILPNVTNSFTYCVKSGRALSDTFTLTCVERPDVSQYTVTYEYPEYTGLASNRVKSTGGEVTAVVGTDVRIAAGLNRPVAEKRMVMNGATLPDARGDAEPLAGEWHVPMRKGLSGMWMVELVDEYGISNRPSAHVIRAIDDVVPSVLLAEPVEKKLRLRPNDSVPISYFVSEDYGIGKAELLLDYGNKKEGEMALPLPVRISGKDGLWGGGATLNLASLNLDGVSRIRARVRIIDNLPENLDGPQAGVSEYITIELYRQAQALYEQAVEQQRKAVAESIKDAQEHTAKAEQKARDKDDQVAQKAEIDDWRQRELEELREQAAAAQAELERLAAEVRETPFARLSEELERVSQEDLQEAREAAAKVPVTDDLDQRREEAQQMEESLSAAAEALRALQEQVNETAEAAEAVGRIAELAREEERLAENAESAQMDGTEAVSDQWRQEQKSVAEEVADLLGQDPQALAQQLKAEEALAQALKAQAQQTGAEESQASQDAQIPSSQEGAQPAGNDGLTEEGEAALREAVQEELARQQAALAEDARDMAQEEQRNAQSQAAQSREGQDPQQAQAAAQEAQQAAQEATQAAQQMEQGNIDAALQSAEAAQESLEDVAEQGSQTEQAGSLADVQERLADAMEALKEGRVAEAAGMLLEDLGAEAAALAEQIRQEAGLSEAEIAPAMDAGEASQGETAESAESGQPSSEAAPTGEMGQAQPQSSEPSGQEQGLGEAMSDQSERMDALAEQAGQSQQSGEPGGLELPSDPQNRRDAFENAMDAAGAEQTQQAAPAAHAAAQALRQMAQNAAEALGMPGVPGELPGQIPGLGRLPGQMPGQMPGQQPGQQPGQVPGTEGKGRDRFDLPRDIPAALKRAGVTAEDWARITGELKGDVMDSGTAESRQEYRDLIKRYFSELARHGNEEKERRK